MQISYEMVSNAHVRQLTVSFNMKQWKKLSLYKRIWNLIYFLSLDQF